MTWLSDALLIEGCDAAGENRSPSYVTLSAEFKRTSDDSKIKDTSSNPISPKMTLYFPSALVGYETITTETKTKQPRSRLMRLLFEEKSKTITRRQLKTVPLKSLIAASFIDKSKNSFIDEDSPGEHQEYAAGTYYKESKLNSVPPYLTLGLTRFTQSPTGEFEKIDNPVHLFDRIDMATHLAEGANPEGVSTEYEIDSVVCHIGGRSGGHYIAYKKNDDGRYTEYNDGRVRVIQNTAKLRRSLNEQCYIVTYKRQ
jgi:hypothetical protein